MDFFGKGMGRPVDIGVPDADYDVPVGDELQDAEPQQMIGQEDVDNAIKTLQDYKAAKANLEKQIVENERWYQMRHWEVMRNKHDPNTPEPASGWLFNSLANKHADAMDNIPETLVLPRERSDEEMADKLSSILPVIFDRAHFEDTYSDNWWEKLKHGTGVYATLWDPQAENGLGDITINQIDLVNIFWEPGIRDIQDSRNVFVVTLEDNDLLESTYPELKGQLGKSGNAGPIEVARYVHDDSIDADDGKTLVVDWYYKIKNADGRTVLQYAKIADNHLLYSSQNDPAYREDGWYHHGLYPFVFDSLYPEKGYPTGFGYINICKSPQIYIDKLGANIMENSLQNSKIRYLISEDTNINAQQFLDYNEPLVKCSGRIDDARIREIKTAPLDSAVLQAQQMKIDEMKETSSNRDVNQGGTSGGVTAAAGIAAQQEAGNKTSRDVIGASFRAYTRISYMVIELVRQFYSEAREFRIVGENGKPDFVTFDNSLMQAVATGAGTIREPLYDIQIRAQKKSPYAREAQNQRAIEFYGAGFFNPENATPSLACLDMMDFEGIEKVRDKVAEGQTLLAMLQHSQQMLQTALVMLGKKNAAAAQTAPAGSQEPGRVPAEGVDERIADSQQPPEMTKYGQQLAANSVVSV